MTDALVVDRDEILHRAEGAVLEETVCGLDDDADLDMLLVREDDDEYIGSRPVCGSCFPDGIGDVALIRTLEQWEQTLPPSTAQAYDPRRDERDLKKAIRALPRGHEIRWGDDGVSDEGFLQGWVDVWAPAVCEPLRWGWAWVVVEPGEEDPWDAVAVTPDATDDGAPLWRPGTISEALSDWCEEHAGRSDLVFRHDPSLVSPVVTWLSRSLRRADHED